LPEGNALNKKVLITGGAGFIGTHLSRRLLQLGHEVTVLDNFSPQIHGGNTEVAADLRGHVQVIQGDVRSEQDWKTALTGQDSIVHLAAETGTGQSMYQVRHYTDVNISGTSLLMDLLLTGQYRVNTLVVASSRAVYGEGAYRCAEHGRIYPQSRSAEDMRQGVFEPKCPYCKRVCSMLPTPESAPFNPTSLYGLTKQVQEQMILMYARTLNINGFGLRYQNVYGPGQSLKNPYTGILAIFSNQARANQPIYVFEDGEESRDFVYIDDVVEVTARCIESDPQPPTALNVGTGQSVSVLDVVNSIVKHYGSESTVTVNGAFREGDIRHNTADLVRLAEVVGYTPTHTFSEGIEQFLNWSQTQEPGVSLYESSLSEMKQRGMLHG
jgi:dTDP-L-rhamnose 4-epimerase